MEWVAKRPIRRIVHNNAIQRGEIRAVAGFRGGRNFTIVAAAFMKVRLYTSSRMREESDKARQFECACSHTCYARKVIG